MADESGEWLKGNKQQGIPLIKIRGLRGSILL